MHPAFAEAGGAFATTRWSIILGSAGEGNRPDRMQAALSELCHVYWRPVYCFVLSRGHSQEDAQDLTQDFFAMVLQGNFLSLACESRGRFRSLLWESLLNFLRDAHRYEHAKKRGGGLKISLDQWKEEHAASTLCSSLMPSVQHGGMRQFDLRWATTLSEQARQRLRQECIENGRERTFSELSHYLAVDAEPGGYESAATVLGLREEAVRVMVSRLRARFRALLREEVAGTLADPDEVKEELSYLFLLLASDR